MRLLRLAIGLFLVTVGLVVATPAASFACSCVMAQTSDYVEWADEVVAGTLIRIEDPPRHLVMSSGDPVTYAVAVDAVYQGDAGERVVFTSSMDGASCGLENMEVDRRYVFFLQGEGDALTTGLCNGNALASTTLVAEVASVTGPPAAPSPGSVSGAAPDHVPESWALGGWLLGGGVLGVVGLVGTFWMRLLRW